MQPYFRKLNALIAQVERKYSEFAGQIKWIPFSQQMAAEIERDSLIDLMAGDIKWSFKHTKPYLNHLSKGCEICGNGLWSCLFITNQCNANCFYCPAKQDYDAAPGTQSMDFNSPEDYVDYLKKFGFKGASISGGEPLLYFERSLAYVKKIRSEMPSDFYIWLYTNGILADTDKLMQLAEAGLNEIRFDIGATGYKLDYVRKAGGIIPVVTIEIPAVPEKKELLKELLPQMIEAGVSNLHFHQLRLTKHNAPKVLQHEYTFLHGEKAVSLESELAALEIMLYAAQNKLPIGINYCNFQYKNRFQTAGYRRMLAYLYRKDHEEITENGYLRTISAKVDNTGKFISLDDLEKEATLYSSVELTYRVIKLQQNFYNAQLVLPADNEAIKLENIWLEEDEVRQFISLVRHTDGEIPLDEKFFALWQVELIEKDWRPYY